MFKVYKKPSVVFETILATCSFSVRHKPWKINVWCINNKGRFHAIYLKSLYIYILLQFFHLYIFIFYRSKFLFADREYLVSNCGLKLIVCKFLLTYLNTFIWKRSFTPDKEDFTETPLGKRRRLSFKNVFESILHKLCMKQKIVNGL